MIVTFGNPLKICLLCKLKGCLKQLVMCNYRNNLHSAYLVLCVLSLLCFNIE